MQRMNPNLLSRGNCDIKIDVCDPQLELTDPNPDVHSLFIQFDDIFFNSILQARCAVRWSTRMTLCAGTCAFDGAMNTISLSKPLLKLRPRSDTINTLLHEMIHAYLFLTMRIRERDGKDGHGPNFQAHMKRINSVAKSNITVYHTFNDEVDHYRNHIWRCDGVCQTWRPHFGLCKRSMNRPPQKADNWFAKHQANCGGTFHKISGPEGSKSKASQSAGTSDSKSSTSKPKTKKEANTAKNVKLAKDTPPVASKKITSYFNKTEAFSGEGHSLGSWKRSTSRLVEQFSPPKKPKVKERRKSEASAKITKVDPDAQVSNLVLRFIHD